MEKYSSWTFFRLRLRQNLPVIDAESVSFLSLQLIILNDTKKKLKIAETKRFKCKFVIIRDVYGDDDDLH